MLFTTSSDRFHDDVLACDLIVLVDFFATWCGPCRVLLPMLETFSSENPDIKVVTVNVDEEPDIAATYEIKTLPTLLVFKNGKIITRSIGSITSYEIEELIQSAMDL
jgi:thioredoxin 1